MFECCVEVYCFGKFIEIVCCIKIICDKVSLNLMFFVYIINKVFLV